MELRGTRTEAPRGGGGGGGGGGELRDMKKTTFVDYSGQVRNLKWAGRDT